MLDIFFAGPDDFYGTVNLLCDLYGARDVIAFEAPAKPAANKMIVGHNLIGRKSGGFCGTLELDVSMLSCGKTWRKEGRGLFDAAVHKDRPQGVLC